MAFLMPTVLELTLCQSVESDPTSKDITLRDCFTNWSVDLFPALAGPFCVFGELTDGLGDAEFVLEVMYFGKHIARVYEHRGRLRFPSRQRVVRLLGRVGTLILPDAGIYAFTLYLDGDWLAHYAVQARLKGATP